MSNVRIFRSLACMKILIWDLLLLEYYCHNRPFSFTEAANEWVRCASLCCKNSIKKDSSAQSEKLETRTLLTPDCYHTTKSLKLFHLHLWDQTYNWREDEIHSYRSLPEPCDSEPSIQLDRRRMWNHFAPVSDLIDGCGTLYICSNKKNCRS